MTKKEFQDLASMLEAAASRMDMLIAIVERPENEDKNMDEILKDSFPNMLMSKIFVGLMRINTLVKNIEINSGPSDSEIVERFLKSLGKEE